MVVGMVQMTVAKRGLMRVMHLAPTMVVRWVSTTVVAWESLKVGKTVQRRVEPLGETWGFSMGSRTVGRRELEKEQSSAQMTAD